VVRIYQVDSFAEKPFTGNPAGVCLLEEPVADSWMQGVAMEMNLSETAFSMPRPDGDFDLRWFTPTIEVELCGHATLATAHILWETGVLLPDQQVRFHTKSGLLTADRYGDRIELDFPASPTEPVDPPEGLLDGFDARATYLGKTRFDYLAELPGEAAVRDAAPDFVALKRLGLRGVIVTARSENPEFDFVSRFFAPGAGINEDPVTGSAHCALAPYWAHKLGKTEMVAFQASKRGGTVHVRLVGDRIKLAGRAVTILRGEILI